MESVKKKVQILAQQFFFFVFFLALNVKDMTTFHCSYDENSRDYLAF